MTPFALQLRAIRATYGLAQGEFARRVGHRQGYVSAIECGAKLPKDTELVERTIVALELDAAHATALREAFHRSQQYELPPPGSPAFAYDLCANFREILPHLTQANAKALQEFFGLIARAQRTSQGTDARSAQRPPEEIAMHR
ncbi:helix-turn-helix transcriptional regulator [Paraburkholderia strydomiana]|uniref:XRE family transcriptional regulator n=1 Tax=Paraburkholderia strydomiana TaxID=1245417 RepID=UPI0038BA638E